MIVLEWACRGTVCWDSCTHQATNSRIFERPDSIRAAWAQVGGFGLTAATSGSRSPRKVTRPFSATFADSRGGWGRI